MPITPVPNSAPFSSPANARQVDGDHYRRFTYQHWDFVVDARLGYLEGCATKYIERHAHKNGVKDLEKAEHFVQKMYECARQGRLKPATGDMTRALNRFTGERVNCGMERELDAIMMVCCWVDRGDLEVALRLVQALKEEYAAADATRAYVAQGGPAESAPYTVSTEQAAAVDEQAGLGSAP